MRPPWMLAVPIGAMLAAGVPARAQVPSYGQPASPDEPPGFDQQGGGVGAGNQPPVLDLAGTWSGEMAGVGGMAGSLREIYQFASNGHFVVVVEGMNGGLVLRIWGSYLTSRVGPNQIRIQSQTDSWAPQQLCRRPAGGTPKCQPLDMPRQAVAVATFVAADTIEIGNGAVGAEAITQHRVAGATPLSGNTPALFVLPGEDSAPERPQPALPPIPLLR